MKKLMRNPIAVLVCGMASLLLFGLIYVWSIFVAPLEAEFGWTRAETSVAYTLSMLCLFVGMALNGVLAARLSQKTALMLGITLAVSGFLGSSCTVSLFTLYLFYGVFVGTGIGICYNAWLTGVVHWFPGRSGFVSGILLAGFGMGGLLFSPLLSHFVTSGPGWRNVFRMIGIVLLAVSVLTAGFLLQEPPQAGNGKKDSSASHDFTTRQMLASPSFYLFSIWKVILSLLGQAVIGQAALIAADIGMPATLSAIGVGLLSAGNGLGRPLSGWLADRFGSWKLMVALSAIFVFLSIGMVAAYQGSYAHLLILLFVLLGLAYGSMALLASSFTGEIYGMKYYRLNYSVVSSTSIVGTLVASYISIIKTATGSYLNFFYIMIGASLFSFLSVVILPFSIRRMNRKYAHT